MVIGEGQPGLAAVVMLHIPLHNALPIKKNKYLQPVYADPNLINSDPEFGTIFANQDLGLVSKT